MKLIKSNLHIVSYSLFNFFYLYFFFFSNFQLKFYDFFHHFCKNIWTHCSAAWISTDNKNSTKTHKRMWKIDFIYYILPGLFSTVFKVIKIEKKKNNYGNMNIVRIKIVPLAYWKLNWIHHGYAQLIWKCIINKSVWLNFITFSHEMKTNKTTTGISAMVIKKINVRNAIRSVSDYCCA